MENIELSPVESAFLSALRGIYGPVYFPVKADGQLHKFKSAPADGAPAVDCWYVLYPHGFAPGWFGLVAGDLVYSWGPHTPNNTEDAAQLEQRKADVYAAWQGLKAPKRAQVAQEQAHAAQADRKRDPLERPAPAPKAKRAKKGAE